jgi:hypothetical protein
MSPAMLASVMYQDLERKPKLKGPGQRGSLACVPGFQVGDGATSLPGSVCSVYMLRLCMLYDEGTRRR